MTERDPYDFSALANDPDFGDDSASVLDGGDVLAPHQFVLSEEADLDFELELEAMVGDEFGALPVTEDEQLRQFQAVLQRLGDSLVDPELEAEEAWLEAMLLEDAAGDAPVMDFLEQLRSGLTGGVLEPGGIFAGPDADLDDL